MSRAGTLGRVWLATGALIAGAIAGLGSLGAGLGVVACACGAGGLIARRRSLLRLAGVVAAAFGLGALSGVAAIQDDSAVHLLAPSVPHCLGHGRVLESAGGLGTVVDLDVLRCDGFESVDDSGTVIADLPRADSGARVKIVGWLVPLGTDSFDAARRRLGAGAAFDAQEVEVGPTGGALNRAAARFRDALRTATSDLDPERAALARGLSIGDTDGMSPRLEEDLRRAGLSHLIAVSGSNVAIVLLAVAYCVVRLRPTARFAAGMCALGFYVVVVGPEPSVLRAAVMGGIGLAAVAYGRRTEPLNALGLALMAVVATRPGLALSVGLHLSAAATAGIVLWAPQLAGALPRVPRIVALPFAVTIAAQAAVAPILVLVFGQLSLVAPFANLIAAPAVPPATVLALTAGAAGIVSPRAGGLIAHGADVFAWWIAAVGHRFGGEDWAAVEAPSIVGWFLVAVVVFAAVMSLRAREGVAGA